MNCKCQQPKKMKNSAGGVDFYVCAKSQGGCGQEIPSAETSLNYHIGVDLGYHDHTAVYQINPHVKLKNSTAIWCTCCGGTGIVKTTFNNGVTKEDSCGYCDGIGEIAL